MSQEKLGEALGVTFQQVQKYEKGTNRVGAGRLHQIGAILGVPVTYFYEGVEADSKAQAAGSRESSVATILETPEGFRLAKAFTAIQNREISRKVVELVEMVSEMQS